MNSTHIHSYSAYNIIAVLSLSFFASVYPFFILTSFEPSGGYFRAFAADAFYYFQIAKNVNDFGFFTFDGTFPTNGFHPLWQSLLSLLYWLTNNEELFLLCSFWLSVGLVAIAAISLSEFCYQLTENLFLSVLLISFGVSGLLSAPLNPNYGALWSFSNAMESGLSLLIFSIIVQYLHRSNFYIAPNLFHTIILSLIVVILIFSRLDDIFFAPALLIPLAFNKHGGKRALYLSIWSTAIIFTCIASYMALNVYYFSSALPISGAMKSGLALIDNLLKLADTIVPLHELSTKSDIFWKNLAWRNLFVFAPALTSATYIYFFVKRYKSREDIKNSSHIIFGASIYAILKSSYNILFVDLGHQGHWYFPISLTILNIHSILAIQKFQPNISSILRPESKQLGITGNIFSSLFALFLILVSAFLAISLSLFLLASILAIASLAIFLLIWANIKKHENQSAPWIYMACVLVILVLGNSFVFNKTSSNYNGHYYSLWSNREHVIDDLISIEQKMKLVSFDDGIIAFSLGFPTMSGLGFALDVDSVSEKINGRLLHHAYTQGYRHIASINYLQDLQATVGDYVFRTQKPFWLSESEMSDFTFKLVYSDPLSGLKIISYNKISDPSR